MRSAMLLLVPFALAACHARGAPPPPAPAEPTAARTSHPAPAAPATPAARPDSQALARALRLRGDAALRDTLTLRINFEFDQWQLRPEDRGLLERKLAILRQNPSVVLRIEGHCDERGSDEYNLALGTRRAATIQAFFVRRGIGLERLQIASFGEERPLYRAHAEWAWAQNRRGDFALVAAPTTLDRP